MKNKEEIKKLNEGLTKILEDMQKEGKEPKVRVKDFQEKIMLSKGFTEQQAKQVTDDMIQAGMKWAIFSDEFVL